MTVTISGGLETPIHLLGGTNEENREELLAHFNRDAPGPLAWVPHMGAKVSIQGSGARVPLGAVAWAHPQAPEQPATR